MSIHSSIKVQASLSSIKIQWLISRLLVNFIRDYILLKWKMPSIAPHLINLNTKSGKKQDMNNHSLAAMI